jgi:single-stranded DNA-binding protein
MNDCTFIGRFLSDPEIQKVASKGDKYTSVLNFRLVVTRRFRKSGEEGTTGKHDSFLDFEAWDSGADVIAKHFRKGDAIIVHTSARNNSYETPDGVRVNKVVFRVEKFDFPSAHGLK